MTRRRPLNPLASPEIRAAAIAIVGNQIPGLAFPVRIDARLTQDLGLSADDRQGIERGIERRFNFPAMGAGGSWHTVEDVANFVALRLRRQEGVARIEASAFRARLTDPQKCREVLLSRRLDSRLLSIPQFQRCVINECDRD